MNLFSFTVGTSYVIFEKQKDPFDWFMMNYPIMTQFPYISFLAQAYRSVGHPHYSPACAQTTRLHAYLFTCFPFYLYTCLHYYGFSNPCAFKNFSSSRISFVIPSVTIQLSLLAWYGESNLIDYSNRLQWKWLSPVFIISWSQNWIMVRYRLPSWLERIEAKCAAGFIVYSSQVTQPRPI